MQCSRSDLQDITIPPRVVGITPQWGSVYLIGRDHDIWTNDQDLVALRGLERENKLVSCIIDT